MKFSRCLMLVTMVASLVVTQSRAEEPAVKKPVAGDQITPATVVSEIAFASELAALGRGELQNAYKSPEALVLAAGILLRAEAALTGKIDELDVKPTDAKGNPVAGEKTASPKLSQIAADLIEEARGMAAGDPSRSKALETLVKQAQTFETRGTVHGPKRHTRTLGAGETHTYNFTFVSGQQAAIAMTSGGPARIQFDLTHVGTNLMSIKGMNANYSWTPKFDKDAQKHYTLTLTNLGKKPTTYTLITN